MADLALFTERPVDAIVGREPSWIIRSGISLLFVVLTLLLLLSWFIRYPDTINSEIVLTTVDSPIKLVSPVSARIAALFVTSGQPVKKGQLIALLQSDVDHDRYLQLQALVEKVEQSIETADLESLDPQDIKGLGQLQPAFNQLNRAMKAYKHFIQATQLAAKIASHKAITEQYQILKQQLQHKKQTLQRTAELEFNLLTKNKALYQQGLISQITLIPFENNYLAKQLALDDLNIQVEQYNLQIKQANSQLTETIAKRSETQQQLQTEMTSSYSALISAVDSWKQQYAFYAAESGQVSLSQFWSVNQHIKRGEVVAIIINDTNSPIGKMALAELGAGKVKVGQTVDIALSSYPALEFGLITGKVSAISAVPQEQGYVVDVELPDKLISSYGHQLAFTPNMRGTAKVVTQHRRLLQRLLDKLMGSE